MPHRIIDARHAPAERISAPCETVLLSRPPLRETGRRLRPPFWTAPVRRRRAPRRLGVPCDNFLDHGGQSRHVSQLAECVRARTGGNRLLGRLREPSVLSRRHVDSGSPEWSPRQPIPRGDRPPWSSRVPGRRRAHRREDRGRPRRRQRGSEAISRMPRLALAVPRPTGFGTRPRGPAGRTTPYMARSSHRRSSDGCVDGLSLTRIQRAGFGSRSPGRGGGRGVRHVCVVRRGRRIVAAHRGHVLDQSRRMVAIPLPQAPRTPGSCRGRHGATPLRLRFRRRGPGRRPAWRLANRGHSPRLRARRRGSRGLLQRNRAGRAVGVRRLWGVFHDSHLRSATRVVPRQLRQRTARAPIRSLGMVAVHRRPRTRRQVRLASSSRLGTAACRRRSLVPGSPVGFEPCLRRRPVYVLPIPSQALTAAAPFLLLCCVHGVRDDPTRRRFFWGTTVLAVAAHLLAALPGTFD